MKEEFLKKISKIDFTKQEKMVIEFILENIDKVYFLTSKDIAKKISLSDTTVIRAIKKSGYNSFTDFKRDLQSQLEGKISKEEELIQNMKSIALNSVQEIFINNINSSLTKIFTKENLRIIKIICRSIRKSDNKFIVGLKSANYIARFMSVRLGYIMKNVRSFLDATSESINALYDANEKDLLLLFDFPIYTKRSELLCKIAKDKKLKIVIISNSINSPCKQYADIFLKVELNGISFFNSLVPAQILVEYILTTVSSDVDRESERFRNIKKYIREKD